MGKQTSAKRRREYGSGSVYKRASDGRWVGTMEAGWTATGNRRRVTVTGATEAEAKRKLRDKKLALERGTGPAAASARATVKTWSDEWLPVVERTLRPKSYITTRGAVRRWIVPTIGGKRLAELSPRDLRAVADAQRTDGKAASSALRTQRVLVKMLRDAVAEGHVVPPSVFAVKAPSKGTSDRDAFATPDALAVLEQASHLPHGSRYAVAFMQGMRQGECLGLTWDAVDFDRGLITVEWQLQALPYRDRRNKAAGFRIPDDYECRHLAGAHHLVRPKSGRGRRVIPMVPWIADVLADWRTKSADQPNPHGLVWTRLDGRPIDKADDLGEWKALQDAAGVRHPAGRHYVTHEARHTTATLLMEAGVSEAVIIAIMGHSSIVTTRAYLHVDQALARAALDKVASSLRLELPAAG